MLTVDETDDRGKSKSPMRLDADLLENLGQLARRYPKPVIMLAENEAPDMAREAARVGVSAYVVDGVAPTVLRSLVDVAIGHFQAHHQLRTELKRAQQTLAERKAVDQAKCLLMERHGVGEEAAYRRLRKIAMDRRVCRRCA